MRRLRFERLKIGSALAAVCTLITILTIFVLLLVVLIPPIISQATLLAEVDYASILSALEDPILKLEDRLAEFGIRSEEGSIEDQLQDTLRAWFSPSDVGNFFGSIISQAGSFIFGLLAVVFIAFFFLQEQGLFVNFLVALVPKEYEEKVRHGVSSITNLLTRYFAGILLQISVITTYVSLLLGILGVPNALLIGFFAAIINVIPYIGPIIGAAFGILITISANLGLDFYTEMVPLLTRVVIVFASMQLIDNFILQPFIFSTSVLAHPLEIFIIVLIGAQINGVVGMILAIPTYTILRVIARVFLNELNIVQKLTRSIGELEKQEIDASQPPPEEISPA